jgi:hypothetical protein
LYEAPRAAARTTVSLLLHLDDTLTPTVRQE